MQFQFHWIGLLRHAAKAVSKHCLVQPRCQETLSQIGSLDQSQSFSCIALILKLYRDVYQFGCRQIYSHHCRDTGSGQMLPNQFSQQALHLFCRHPDVSGCDL
ncbi:hypothetical protein [Thalassovita sp.]|uniref:hypothetical protein n=1 Tax=Thalassovita sp. TaxID=1979401 RepID=UPI003B5A7306